MANGETSVEGAKPAPVIPEIVEKEPSLNNVGAVRADATIDELIPAELRDIVNKTEKEAAENKEKEKTVVKKADAKEETTTTEKKVETKEDDELNLSSENIDKMLEGDDSAVVKGKEETKEDDTPVWHENKEYQALVKKAANVGIKQEDLDKIITEASDVKSVANSKFREGLETKVTTLESTNQTLTKEVTRLREVERAAHFDSLKETHDKYGVPMGEATRNMKRILDMEGVTIPISKILLAKNRAEFSELIKDADIDDDMLTQLTNHWRGYKDLEMNYSRDKADAQKDLTKHLSTNVPKEEVEKHLRHSLTEFLKADPERYGYITKAIQDGLDKPEHQEVNEALGGAKINFHRVMQALSNPSDYVRNNAWIEGVAKFFLKAHHSFNIEEKYEKQGSELSETKTNLAKVVRAYRELAGSARGITGKNGVEKRVSSQAQDDDSASLIEGLNGLLSGDKKIEDLIPS